MASSNVRFKLICCLPAFLVIIAFFVALIILLGLSHAHDDITELLRDSRLLPIFVVLSCILFLSCFGSFPMLFQLMRSLLLAPTRHLKSAAATLSGRKVSGRRRLVACLQRFFFACFSCRDEHAQRNKPKLASGRSSSIWWSSLTPGLSGGFTGFGSTPEDAECARLKARLEAGLAEACDGGRRRPMTEAGDHEDADGNGDVTDVCMTTLTSGLVDAETPLVGLELGTGMAGCPAGPLGPAGAGSVGPDGGVGGRSGELGAPAAGLLKSPSVKSLVAKATKASRAVLATSTADMLARQEFSKACALLNTFDRYLNVEQTRVVFCVDATETNQREKLATLIYQVHSFILAEPDAPVAVVIACNFKVGCRRLLSTFDYVL